MKYAWIKENQNAFDVSLMCECLGITRSCYYAWRNSQPSVRAKENELLCEDIRAIFEVSRQTYGTRRIRRELFKKGKNASRRRIGKLMCLMGLSCKTKRKFRVTTDSKHKLPIADNVLQRHFDVDAPNRFYVGDITYIHTQSGWLYLAVVIDLFSRKVVGWAMDENMRAGLVNDALLMALWKRKPNPGLVSHTDRGSQYASDSHRQILKDHEIKQSMSRKGDCWDNGVPRRSTEELFLMCEHAA